MPFLKGHRSGMTGRKHSEKTKQLMSQKQKGSKMSEKAKEKLRLCHLGRKMSEAVKEKISISHRGEKSYLWKGGPPKCLECGKGLANYKAKRCIKHKGVKGDKSPHWKGGITPLNLKIRTSAEYKIWRKAVFERDNYTCIWCRAKNGNGKTIKLNADHIKKFADHPELRDGAEFCR